MSSENSPNISQKVAVNPSNPSRNVSLNTSLGIQTNIKLTIAYDGTGFSGLAPNPGVRTIVGEIKRVLVDLLGLELGGVNNLDIVMSGRTDAGVHAFEQVLSFGLGSEVFERLESRGGIERISKTINSRLAPEIAAKAVEIVSDDFSARFSAKSRSYRYFVLNSSVHMPHLDGFVWWLPQKLNVEEMNLCASHFVGEHDFSSFCRAPKVAPGEAPASLVRKIIDAKWTNTTNEVVPGFESLVVFDIQGSAFCHQMVRSLVGFCVDVGLGRRQSSEVVEVLAARDRSVAGQIAPAKGLTLLSVSY